MGMQAWYPKKIVFYAYACWRLFILGPYILQKDSLEKKWICVGLCEDFRPTLSITHTGILLTNTPAHPSRPEHVCK